MPEGVNSVFHPKKGRSWKMYEVVAFLLRRRRKKNGLSLEERGCK